MPGAAIKFEPDELDDFAKYMARFDLGNPSEAEAMNAGRFLRRLLVKKGVRLVDAMGRADVMQALDAQLEPVREESPELKEAFGQITQLADALARERELTAELRGELSAVPVAGMSARPMPPPRASDGGMVNGGLVAVVSMMAVLLMLAAWFQSFQ
jgi:hypothetical protein